MTVFERVYAQGLVIERPGQDAALALSQVRGTAGTRRNGVWQFAITDHLGNERVRFDQDGRVLERNHYYAYGLRHPGWSSAQVGTSDARYAFAGGTRTADELDVQWQRNGARMYDPVLGRFLGVEPLADIYSSISGYAYALCDPVNRRDPSGFFAEECGCDPKKDPDCEFEGSELETVVITPEPVDEVSESYIPRGYFFNGVYILIFSTVSSSDATHVVLGVIGSSEIPVLSQIADIFDAGLSLTEGDFVGAGMSAGGILVPGLSQAKLGRTLAKAGGRAAQAGSKAAKMAKARAAGKAGEEAAGITGKKQAFKTPDGRTRIPDKIDDNAKKIIEVKNVKNQGLTAQIKDSIVEANRRGYTFELHVRVDTQISKPLQNAIDAGQVILKRSIR